MFANVDYELEMEGAPPKTCSFIGPRRRTFELYFSDVRYEKST